MERFTSAVYLALDNENWYGALAVALTLPDICGRLENPDSGSKQRYVAWFDRYMLDRYSHPRFPHVFLCGEDCYALRCSYLHEGGNNIEEQRARKALRDFHFIAPRPGATIHLNQYNDTLQLQTDIFCRDICDGVQRWSQEVLQANPTVQERAKGLLVVHPPGNVPGFRFGAT